jgi:hypothetical protein
MRFDGSDRKAGQLRDGIGWHVKVVGEHHNSALHGAQRFQQMEQAVVGNDVVESN